MFQQKVSVTVWLLRSRLILPFLFLPFLLVYTLTSADVVFEKKELKIDGKVLSVEIADTPARRRQGLMNRKELPIGSGMLFIFEREFIQKFWMKDTFIDLSIGFFNKDRVLTDIQDMDGIRSIMQKDIPRVSSQFPAQFALEVRKGWFKKNQITLGAKFSLK